jgi:hypothetical protein
VRSRLAIAVATAGALLLGSGAFASNQSAALSDTHVRRLAVSSRVASALGPAGELRGMALNDQQATERDVVATIADFPRMAADGINSVSVYVYLYVTDDKASDVHSGALTLTDQEISTIASAAQANGMGFQLQPVLLDEGPHEWRGFYRPTDISAFFESYTPFVVHYADLAQSIGASLYYVGSENDLLIKQTARWQTLIATVRQHYSGALSYMTTGYKVLDVKFWRQLDLVSFSPYFSLGTDATPTYERDLAAWAQVHTPYVRSLAKKLRMPMIYGEAGYHSQQHAYAYPQLAAGATDLPAPAAQADAYRALLDVLAQEASVYGVTWWRWSLGSTSVDTSYSPANKPAECVLALHWSQDPTVRQAAAGPQCDLHSLDAALFTVGSQLPH